MVKVHRDLSDFSGTVYVRSELTGRTGLAASASMSMHALNTINSLKPPRSDRLLEGVPKDKSRATVQRLEAL